MPFRAGHRDPLEAIDQTICANAKVSIAKYTPDNCTAKNPNTAAPRHPSSGRAKVIKSADRRAWRGTRRRSAKPEIGGVAERGETPTDIRNAGSRQDHEDRNFRPTVSAYCRRSRQRRASTSAAIAAGVHSTSAGARVDVSPACGARDLRLSEQTRDARSAPRPSQEPE